MTIPSEFWVLAAVHFLAVVLPGPDFVVTTRNSIIFGKRYGLLTALGIGCGISVHVIYTVLGFSAVTHTIPSLVVVLQLLGIGYLVYLSINLFKSGLTGGSKLELSTAANVNTKQTGYYFFKMGFLTNALNPKATVFFLSVFTVIVPETTPVGIQTIYGVWMCAVNAIWFAAVAIFFSNSNVQKLFAANMRWFEMAMGAILFYFSIRLLAELFL
ncbi:MAG: LysE family translocator [Sulfitobacter sp.]